MKRWLVLIIVLVIVGGAAGGGFWYWERSRAVPNYRTTAVQRGDLQFVISATGTIEPEEVVDVGAQVAGLVLDLGDDPRDYQKAPKDRRKVDYRTPVEGRVVDKDGKVIKDGTILAKIDDTLYRADRDQAAAALKVADAAEEVAEANQMQAEKNLGQLQAKYDQAAADMKRIDDIRARSGIGAIAQSEYDMYKAAFLSADSSLAVGKANVAVTKSAVSQAKSTVGQAKVALDRAQKNLEYCTIWSPVDGEIIDRRVNVGQTVVSSLNAPSLFLLGKDLTKMQVWVQVNEADIGQIHPDQDATFTVDAYPGETFKGKVLKIRLNATMTNNVVTYTVEVYTDNTSGRLLPYLTANLNFDVEKRTNVLMVPNAALRWWPQPTQIAPDAKDEVAKISSRSKGKTGDAKPGDGKSADGTAPKEKGERGTVWVQDGKYVRPIRVRVFRSDGVMTEIQSDALPEGKEVVIGEVRQNDTSAGGANPFAPQMFGGQKKGP
jgi:HlyD family secretion protein